MEIPLIITLLVLVLIVFPIWAIVRIISLGGQNDALAHQLQAVERDLQELREKLRGDRVATPAVASSPPPVVEPKPIAQPPIAPPPRPVAAAAPVVAREAPPAPPPLPTPQPPLPPRAPEPSFIARIDWEQFMGVKLFAWLGGLAALLGVAFFLKYAFEHNFIPPEVRAAAGFLFGAGLILFGLKLDRGRYAAGAQTLIATGVVSLYAVTFACNAVYHFAFFGQLPTFLLMTLITGTAFLLAVRLEARVIAILGMLGGFLTPVLLSTGHDNPPGLFGYIALLDIGLIAVALHRRWNFLVALGAGGTVLMQLGWAGKFLTPEKAPTAMVVCLAFCALFLAAYEVARRLERRTTELTGAALAFPFVAFGFALAFLFYSSVAARPGLLFAFIFAADLGLLTLAWLDEQLPKLHLVAGAAVFALLAAWTASRLTEPLLPWALAAYLLHAVLHTAFPLVLQRRRPDAAPTWWSQLFPPLALLLMFGPLLKLDSVSLLFWPCVLLVDLLAIGLALFTASLTAVAVVLVLTLIATGLWVFQVPATISAEPSLLLVLGGFAVLFFAASIFVARKLGDRLAGARDTASGLFGDARAQLPAFSALLPFLLLIMMTQRLPLADPSAIFGLALLLTVLTLGLATLLTLAWLPVCALVGVVALEFAWASRHSAATNHALQLGWFLFFYAGFTFFPFVFRRRFAALTGPWAVAALAGLGQFYLVYHTIDRGWPNDIMGLVPALFAVPPLVGLIAILRADTVDARARLNQLAWFGGVALFFITLVFPIQFERQWLTIGWALEGTALLWLFHRVPHPGLRATGAALLVAAFVRLTLNHAVFAYHARSDVAIFNWYLYAYGLVTACLFVGARLTAPPRDQVLGVSAPPLFNTLGTLLAFFLLNIEIADYFSPAGGHALTFEFSGNFARDMTYTIAWALFALGLLLISMWRDLRVGRYAALALLGVALLKLFFHDLARLEALYRIGALFAVAIIATLASFAYQRFLPGTDKHAPEKP